MTITKENYYTLLPSLRQATSTLKGSERRMFLGQLALDLKSGGKVLVSKTLNISRVTLRKGISEAESGIPQKDMFNKRGRKPLGEIYPELIEKIKEIADDASQTDPQFKSTRLYTRLSVKEIRIQLIKLGHTNEELPSNQTIWNKLIDLGFKRRKVAKTAPKKKIKETDAIFNQLDIENKNADAQPNVLRISYDAKDRVKVGNFSRGGKNWKIIKAGDHDFGGEYITPFGLFLPEFKETFLYFTESKVTADFMVDVLIDFWNSNKKRFWHIDKIVINSDNGPECNSRRTQFIKRICEFAKDNNIVIQLAYYPPYHSKYNPIERVWGGLEQHWNGDILDTKETVLKFAENFVWAGKHVVVKHWTKVYEIGKKLSAKAMKLYETAIDRLNETIGKWFITIIPEKVKATFNSG